MKKFMTLLILALLTAPVFAGEGENLDKKCKKNIQASRDVAGEDEASGDANIELVEDKGEEKGKVEGEDLKPGAKR